MTAERNSRIEKTVVKLCRLSADANIHASIADKKGTKEKMRLSELLPGQPLWLSIKIILRVPK